jgi:uncharacterized delta-60 repeat protein
MNLKLLVCILIFIGTKQIVSQVPDSTFGEPYSFYGNPNYYAPGVTAVDFNGHDDQAFSVLHLNDGKIILAGYTKDSAGADFALARLLPDGKFDQTLGANGWVKIDWGCQNDSCLVAVLYEDSKIIMGGCGSPNAVQGYVCLLAKTDTDGNFDDNFGDGGKVQIDLPADFEMISEIIPQSNGKVLIGGTAFYGEQYFYPDSTVVFVGRILGNGQIDSTFGENGFIFRRFEYECLSTVIGEMILDENGRIVVTGSSYDQLVGSYGFNILCSHEIILFRFNSNGTTDSTFGDKGIVRLTNTEGRGNALYLQSDGKILVSGVISDFLTPPSYVYIARLLPNGLPDTTFAENGSFMKFIPGQSLYLEPVAITSLNEGYVLLAKDKPNAVIFGMVSLTAEGQLMANFGNTVNNGVFSSYSLYQTFFYYLNNISISENNNSIYLSGYYRLLGNNNMVIFKFSLNDSISAIPLSLTPSSLKCYPNPVTNSEVIIELPQGNTSNQNKLLTIYNGSGQRVLTQNFNTDKIINKIDLSGFNSGIYFVYLFDGDKIFYDKIIVCGK